MLGRSFPPGALGPIEPFLVMGSVRVATNINMANVVFFVLYIVLLIGLIALDHLLATLTQRIQEKAKLPNLSVVQHYQDTGYTAVVLTASGWTERWRKIRPQQRRR